MEERPLAIACAGFSRLQYRDPQLYASIAAGAHQLGDGMAPKNTVMVVQHLSLVGHRAPDLFNRAAALCLAPFINTFGVTIPGHAREWDEQSGALGSGAQLYGARVADQEKIAFAKSLHAVENADLAMEDSATLLQREPPPTQRSASS